MSANQFEESVAREFYNVWNLLGLLAGLLSVISLVHKMIGVGLYGFPALIFQYYQNLLAPIRAAFLIVAPFDLPSWYIELYLLALLGMTSSLRASFRTNPALSSPNDQLETKIEEAIFVFFVSASLAVLIFPAIYLLQGPIIVLWRKLFRSPGTPEELALYRASVYQTKSLIVMAAAVVAFFIWNFQSA